MSGRRHPLLNLMNLRQWPNSVFTWKFWIRWSSNKREREAEKWPKLVGQKVQTMIMHWYNKTNEESWLMRRLGVSNGREYFENGWKKKRRATAASTGGWGERAFSTAKSRSPSSTSAPPCHQVRYFNKLMVSALICDPPFLVLSFAFHEILFCCVYVGEVVWLSQSMSLWSSSC